MDNRTYFVYYKDQIGLDRSSTEYETARATANDWACNGTKGVRFVTVEPIEVSHG